MRVLPLCVSSWLVCSTVLGQDEPAAALEAVPATAVVATSSSTVDAGRPIAVTPTTVVGVGGVFNGAGVVSAGFALERSLGSHLRWGGSFDISSGLSDVVFGGEAQHTTAFFVSPSLGLRFLVNPDDAVVFFVLPEVFGSTQRGTFDTGGFSSSFTVVSLGTSLSTGLETWITPSLGVRVSTDLARLAWASDNLGGGDDDVAFATGFDLRLLGRPGASLLLRF